MNHLFPKKDFLISVISLTIGAILAALALDTLLIPNTILDGGVNGISIIIYDLLAIIIN